ncbi:MAG: C4-dicarboxylate ABC transporter, partial [Pseudomonadota bacterium]
MRTVLIAALAAIVLTATPSISAAQEVTIRLHHFLSQRAPLHSQMLVPFAEKVADASGGRLKIEIFDSMSLGGRPGDLFDQAVDGAVDA